MKNINFIKPISSAQTRAIGRWCLSSSLLLVFIFFCLAIVTWQEYSQLKILKNQQRVLQRNIASFNSVMQHTQALKKQEQTLIEQLAVITQAHKKMQQQGQLLAYIKKTLKNSASLESFNIESSQVQLCIDCAQMQQASVIVSQLTQWPDLKELHLNSLQPKQLGTTTALRLNLNGIMRHNS